MSRERRLLSDEPFLLVRSAKLDHANAARLGEHAHDWHQIAYVAVGLMVVETASRTWVAPPSWAVWIPAGVAHAVRSVGCSSLRMIYLRPADSSAFSDDCRSTAVSPFLRELIIRATEVGMLDQRDPVEAAIATLLLAELGPVGPPPLALPQPTSPALVEAARLISSRRLSLAATAAAVGLGARTLERRFKAETGMGLGRWHQHARLLKGLERVAAGGTVKGAAVAAGFSTASSFVAACRQVTGCTPGRFFQPPAQSETELGLAG